MGVRSFEESANLSGTAHLNAMMPGKIFFNGDEGYDSARGSWNILDDKHPGVVVYVENKLDVIEMLSFAQQNSLPVAVQATGHRRVGSLNGSVLINTSRMNEVHVNPQSQTAWVDAGVKWGKVLQHAQPYGLAPLLGSSSDVGAVGYTLSGGIGWLVRKYGMCVDSVLRLEVVTPDSKLRIANPTENSDLFWALCGGGGGFGVVTGMEIRLFPVSTVYAGNLYYPASMAREVFNYYRQWIADAPDELTCSIVLMNYPPIPQLPPVLRGQSFVIIRGCYAGPTEKGEKLLDFWRAWQSPTIDEFQARPFTEADNISKDPVNPMPALFTGEWINDLSDEVVDTLIRHTFPKEGPPVLVLSEVRLAGGAVSKVDPSSNAYSHRNEKLIWCSIASPGSSEMQMMIEHHLLEMRKSLAQHLTGKVFMNFLEGDEMRHRTPDGYSDETFQRLRRIKAKYDPEYRFVSSFDIPPFKA